MSGKIILAKSQIKALKTNDLSPMINMSGLMVPRIVKVFLETLNQKERAVFIKSPSRRAEEILRPPAGTPTPPIVIGLANLQMMTMSEEEVIRQKY